MKGVTYMKKRQLRLMALALMLTTGFSLTGCEESTAVNPTKPESIYALAVENGYTGTYEDWVNLLKGDKGDTGTQGPKGDKGDTGDKGEKGDKGDTGDKGDKGDKGDTGETGQQGEKGDKGDKGDSGTSIVKIEKTSSENGVDTYTITYSDNTTSTFQVTNGKDGTDASVSISEDGYWIVNGTKTDIPVTGAKGDKGDTGEKGEKGDTGAQGEKGDTGDKGDAGAKGDKGDKGDKGTDGTSWHTGKGAPDISLTALEGDFYFDTESGCIYKCSDSKWVLIYQIAKNIDYQFTVTLDLNGGFYDGETTFTVPYGGFIEQLPEPTKFAAEFVGFYTGLGQNDMKFTPYTPVYRDMKLIAVYDEISLQKRINVLKSQLYNHLDNLTDHYKEMTEKQKNEFMNYIASLNKTTSYEEAEEIFTQCNHWIDSVFNNWKSQTKRQLSSIISEVETINPDFVSYLETIQSSVNDWDETYNFAEFGITNVCNIIYNLASNKRSLSDKGNFENEFINSRNAYAEILTRLLGDYKKAVQASDDWAKAKEYFSTYNEESTIQEYLKNIVFILDYIPNNIIDLDFKDPDAIKTCMADEKKGLLSEQYYSNYQPVLDRVFNLIDSNSSEEDCRLIVSMFSVVSDFCRSQAPDDFSSNVMNFISWYYYDVGAIKFTTDDFIKILTEEESIDDENMTNLFYMEKQLDIVEYLNGRRDPEERYRQSAMVFQHFLNSTSITVEKLKTMKTYLDSYMTREYTCDMTPSTYELDLLLNLSDKNLDTDTISSSIADEFVHQADYITSNSL